MVTGSNIHLSDIKYSVGLHITESGEGKDMKRKFDLTPIPSEDSVFGELEDVFPEVVMEEVPVFEDMSWSGNGLEVWSHYCFPRTVAWWSHNSHVGLLD